MSKIIKFHNCLRQYRAQAKLWKVSFGNHEALRRSRGEALSAGEQAGFTREFVLRELRVQ